MTGVSQIAFDFVDRVSDLSLESVSKELLKSLSNIGFDYAILVGIPTDPRDFSNFIITENWPDGWFETYSSGQFAKFDPVLRHCLRTVMPFAWHEAPFDLLLDHSAAIVMREACHFGLHSGLALPIHGAGGYEACFSISGASPRIDRHTRPAIHLMLMYAYDRLVQLTQSKPIKAILTPREVEVLRWAALGKSSADISDILSISERTVVAHTTNAMGKLGVGTRTAAVASAISRRLLQL